MGIVHFIEPTTKATYCLFGNLVKSVEDKFETKSAVILTKFLCAIL